MVKSTTLHVQLINTVESFGLPIVDKDHLLGLIYEFSAAQQREFAERISGPSVDEDDLLADVPMAGASRSR